MAALINDPKLYRRWSDHCQRLRMQPLASLCQLSRPPLRFQIADLTVNMENHYVDTAMLDLFDQYATRIELPEKIHGLFSGEIVNQSEQKPASHPNCRIPEAPHIHSMTALASQIIENQWCGITGNPFSDIVVIGMGGSILGTKLLLHALKPLQKNSLQFHLLDNIADEFIDHIASLSLETTLFVVVSKSFTTPEVILNTQLCLQQATAKFGSTFVQQHVLAITSNVEKASQIFDIPTEHILKIPPDVGGRYSIWSTTGFPVMLAIGQENFCEFLRGGHTIDAHLRTTPITENIPILMAMLSVMYSNWFGFQSHLILPYAERLATLPAYLQQLTMESNGKSVTEFGDPIDYQTSPIIWGEKCSSAQHSFFQFLHQGTQKFSADLILPIYDDPKYPAIQTMQATNCHAQSKAFTVGEHQQASHVNVAGSRPHHVIELKNITPLNLGALLAIYEHKTIVEALILKINPFDQWGVELGKRLCTDATVPSLTKNMTLRLACSE